MPGVTPGVAEPCVVRAAAVPSAAMSRRVLLALIAFLLLGGAGAAASLLAGGDGQERSPSAAAPVPGATSPPTTTQAGRSGTTTAPGAAGDRATAPPEEQAGRELIVGMGDQNAAALDAPAFRALGLRHARLIVPYDAMSVGYERDLVAGWLEAAARAGVEPFVTFGHSRERPKRLPSVAEYAKAVGAFRRAHPQVRIFAPWNEINHRSQPTSRAPARAAAFHDALAARCPDCTVVAGDLLDQPGMLAYLRRYRAALRRPARLWGLHNYSDTNRFRASGTRTFLAAVPGDVWLTETGGVFRFGRNFPASQRRQARAVDWSVRLARREPRIRRLYLYNWTGAPADARFDAGLVDAEGRPRRALGVLRAALRR
jgi:hypothetical protein